MLQFNYIFFILKNDDQLLEKSQRITYYSIENTKELAEKLKGIEISNNATPKNFKNMNFNQKIFVSEYRDKEFITFLES